jgi:hypothetical protein
MLFTKSISKFDVKFDYERQLQSAELFKRLFIIKLIKAGFDKSANARYFALRFPQILKIHKNRSFKNTINLNKLQEIIKLCKEMSENSEREETYWLKRLRKFDYLIKRSRFSSPNDNSNPAPFIEAAGIDTYNRAN